jgi:hypothetical protein
MLDAGPNLPCSISRLPDSEIHGLLFVTSVGAQVRVSGNGPPVSGDQGYDCILRHGDAPWHNYQEQNNPSFHRAVPFDVVVTISNPEIQT